MATNVPAQPVDMLWLPCCSGTGAVVDRDCPVHGAALPSDVRPSRTHHAREARIRALHERVSGSPLTVCSHDGMTWPCPTVALLDAAPAGGAE